jgi:hypothetical protein
VVAVNLVGLRLSAKAIEISGVPSLSVGFKVAKIWFFFGSLILPTEKMLPLPAVYAKEWIILCF